LSRHFPRALKACEFVGRDTRGAVLRESAVIRMSGEELVWYPPGGGRGPRSLADGRELHELKAVAAARRAPLVFAAPAADVVLRTVEFAAGEKRHIASSLPFLLEDDFAADVESLHFASRPLSKLSLGVAACDRDRMAAWSERLAGLPAPTRWIPEPLLLPWRAGELCVVIEAELVLVRHGANEGFGIDRSLAPAALESLAATGAFDTVVVYGADPDRDRALLPEALREPMQWRTGNFASALMLSGEDRQPLNLLQGEYGVSLPLRRWWVRWRLAAGLFAAAFGLQVAATWADYERLESEQLELRRQVEAAYREAVPAGEAVDPERQLRARLAALRGGVGAIGFVGLMERAGGVVREQRSARIDGVNFSDGSGDLRLDIVVSDFKALEAIRARMDEAGLAVTMENSDAQGRMVRARLRVKAK